MRESRHRQSYETVAAAAGDLAAVGDFVEGDIKMIAAL